MYLGAAAYLNLYGALTDTQVSDTSFHSATDSGGRLENYARSWGDFQTHPV